MKSAEEVAGNVVAFLDEHNILLTDSQWAGLRTETMKALNAFAAEALEEAAKVADKYGNAGKPIVEDPYANGARDYSDQIAADVRALKDAK